MKLFNKQKGIKIQGQQKTSTFRLEHNKILREDVLSLPNIKSVLNVGAVQNDPDKEGMLYKDYFKDKEYYTTDKNFKDDSPLHFEADLHDVSPITRKFDLILLMNVLEHVRDPFKCLGEITKLLNQGGYIYFASPFFYPIHKSDHGFSDYWRFTDDGIRELFKGYKEIWMKENSSVIRAVEDRALYWDSPKSTPTGYCALFQLTN